MPPRVVVGSISLVCLAFACYLTAGAWLLNDGKAESVRLAARWMPWNAEAWRLMPQVEPDRATEHWRHVLRLAPRDIEARLALAMDAELAGRPGEAEPLLLEAASVHKGYLPAWTLANFYLRQGDQVQFWRWARRAATFEVDLTALFELALRVRPEPDALLAEFALKRPIALRQLLVAAGHADLLQAALGVADRVARYTPDEQREAAREVLLWDADDLLKKRRTELALTYWNLAARNQLLSYPVAKAPTLINGDFAHATLERGFDWRPGSAEVSVTMGRGLHIGLYGKQDDTAVLLAQTIVLEPGMRYELCTRYRSNLPAAAHPIRWTFAASTSPPLTPRDWREACWEFDASNATGELKLISRAEPGTHRAPGELELEWVRIANAAGESSASLKR